MSEKVWTRKEVRMAAQQVYVDFDRYSTAGDFLAKAIDLQCELNEAHELLERARFAVETQQKGGAFSWLEVVSAWLSRNKGVTP